MPSTATQTTSRRDRQREETRRDLALAAFELAVKHGLANVRVPDIAAEAGVSPRTFNNYFASKEDAIVWPAARRAGRLADAVSSSPRDEHLDRVLIRAVGAGSDEQDELSDQWLARFRALVGQEPTLRGAYLRACDSAEVALADAIAARLGMGPDALEPWVLAATTFAAERAAIRHWMRTDRSHPLNAHVEQALGYALDGLRRNR